MLRPAVPRKCLSAATYCVDLILDSCAREAEPAGETFSKSEASFRRAPAAEIERAPIMGQCADLRKLRAVRDHLRGMSVDRFLDRPLTSGPIQRNHAARPQISRHASFPSPGVYPKLAVRGADCSLHDILLVNQPILRT